MRMVSRLGLVLTKLRHSARSSMLRYLFTLPEDFRNDDILVERKDREKTDRGFCSTCGNPITLGTEGSYTSFHNADTCRLVNIALTEMGVSLDQTVRVVVYPNWGPLKGYYSTADPLTIHVAEDVYSHFPEYIIFHETKHLVDCLTKGWSEEGTPDPFARNLCRRHGFSCPPPGQDFGPVGSYSQLPF